MVFIFIRLAFLMPMVGADTLQADGDAKMGSAFQSQSHASARIEDRRPCNCEAMNSKWSPPARTNAKCVFIDLGAAGGNTLNSFLNDEYGPVANCILNGDWEAFLVEANPVFNDVLSELEWLYPGNVHSLGGNAAYMCKGETTFFVDTDPTHNYWGSSMEGGVHNGSDWLHPDHMRNQTGVNKRTNVTVPFVNVPQLIYENTIPADHVIVKMDIEGAEWDILPCLSRSQAVGTLDSLYMEVHPASWQLGNTTPAELTAAQSTLIQKGVAIPLYYSPTL